ncbi:hypothetical protein FHS40_008724 [Streptomyces spectabilis]|uniref:Uncharacterized protein n=1 Tax=Streptomyces spectabilis TaxID=68270 RepID=A0A7W8B4K0_STRST|nr:hypothetical protein [Streptomyces spectabilis]
MEHSALPYERLLSVDVRLRHAAAVPLIIQETVVVDGGKAFLPKIFRAVCNAFGTEVIHAPPAPQLISLTSKEHWARQPHCSLSFSPATPDARPNTAAARPRTSRCSPRPRFRNCSINGSAPSGRTGPTTPYVPHSPRGADVLPKREVRRAHGDGRIPPAPADRGGLPGTAAEPLAGRQLLRRQGQSPDLQPRRPAADKVRDRPAEEPLGTAPRPLRRPALWLCNHRTGQWIIVPWRLLSTSPTPFGELAWGAHHPRPA